MSGIFCQLICHLLRFTFYFFKISSIVDKMYVLFTVSLIKDMSVILSNNVITQFVFYAFK